MCLFWKESLRFRQNWERKTRARWNGSSKITRVRLWQEMILIAVVMVVMMALVVRQQQQEKPAAAAAMAIGEGLK